MSLEAGPRQHPLATEDLIWQLNGLGIDTGVERPSCAKPATGCPGSWPAEPVSHTVRALSDE